MTMCFLWSRGPYASAGLESVGFLVLPAAVAYVTHRKRSGAGLAKTGGRLPRGSSGSRRSGSKRERPSSSPSILRPQLAWASFRHHFLGPRPNLPPLAVPRIENVPLNLFAGREPGATVWDVPLAPPVHHWTVPLAVMDGNEPRRVGTAFHFSQLGHLFTARHCVDEALALSNRGRPFNEQHRVQVERQLIVVRANDADHEHITALPVQTVTGPEPSDLVCLSTVFQETMPQLTLPISFALPAAGSLVRCFGFPSSTDGTLFPDRLHAVEGPVKAYFPPGFSRGFVRGPCFLVGAFLPHGMSGGPVVNEEGSVCGIASAGAQLFFDEPTYLVSPIYPAMLIEIALHAEPASNVRINGARSLLDLCADAYVRTDGTEHLVHFLDTGAGLEVGPVLPRPNGDYVYDSFEDYQAGRRSSPVSEPRMRIVRHAGFGKPPT
jgi:hypothetical protein